MSLWDHKGQQECFIRSIWGRFLTQTTSCWNCFSVLVKSIKNGSAFSECYYWFMKQQMCLLVSLCMRACINGILHSPSFSTAAKGRGRLIKVTGESENINENQEKWAQFTGMISNVLVLCYRKQWQTQSLPGFYSMLLQCQKSKRAKRRIIKTATNCVCR